jgi:2-C-methyl-D-erythritol 4-phosphate cytidylyltransferase
VREIIVVARRQDEKKCAAVIKKYGFKGVKVVTGGKERQDSVYNGLKSAGAGCEVVLVHDAARPFVSAGLVRKLLRESAKHGAVIPAVPIKETVKRSSDGKNVDATLDRKKLFLAQTPQVFHYGLLLDAHRAAREANLCGTDDAMLVERLGKGVKIVAGEEKNIKVTVRDDIRRI